LVRVWIDEGQSVSEEDFPSGGQLLIDFFPSDLFAEGFFFASERRGVA
jgi:hypothetical protein